MDTATKIPLLSLSNIYRRFPAGENEITVLDDINLTIMAGEMVAIMGASGSGKSTLMNILGCLDRPTSGSYCVDGRETQKLDGDQLAALRREHFGFIFQRYHLLPHLDAISNVEVPAIYAGTDVKERHERSRRLLERLGLSDRVWHRPNQLSGGQQQRVSIARALMNGGDVILADEPTGALDSKSGVEVMEVLRELHELGHTVILVTHDAQVASYAERIIELCDGSVVSDQPNPEQPPKIVPILQKPHAALRSRLAAMINRFGEAFKMAGIAMLSHRMRTLLTMLGIIIGITSVVSVVALGQGMRERVISDINAMGTNTIDIYPGSSWGDRRSSRVQTLVANDLDTLSQLPYIDSVTPGISGNVSLRYGNIEATAQITGVSEQFFRVRGFTIAEGVTFRAEDIEGHMQTVVIDSNTRKKLFSIHENPIGKVILAGSLPLVVVGVTDEKELMNMMGQNLNVWIPYSTAMSKLLGRKYFSNITVRIKDNVPNELAEQNITKLLTLRHGTQDFFTSSSDAILQTVNKTTLTITLVISAIAVISLIVGGIGVMNIMLVSVTERTQEIGIRMAVGARQSDILQQFLIEAVLVCLLGGLIGIAFSYGVGALFPLFVKEMSMSFSMVSIVAAFVCSSLIGLIFGFLPARNAARLDPIEALARE
ncbi:MAG: MacB family efflux pump subunit [Burkholderiales bacterium]|jgi:macrolide transport system ATP-binding/permease protein|nr:MacB family efflux pump subunit [Burkholderiales bacterium]